MTFGGKRLAVLGSRRFAFVFLSVFVLTIPALVTRAQQRCLEPGRIEILKKQISDNIPAAADAKLQNDLVSASGEFRLATRIAAAEKLSTDIKKQDSDKPGKKQRSEE